MFVKEANSTAVRTNHVISDKKLNVENNYEEAKREVNSKILKISLKINFQYPELSKYLETMPVTFPVETKPEITLKGLSTYYDSLNVLLNYHMKDHSNKANL